MVIFWYNKLKREVLLPMKKLVILFSSLSLLVGISLGVIIGSTLKVKSEKKYNMFVQSRQEQCHFTPYG